MYNFLHNWHTHTLLSFFRKDKIKLESFTPSIEHQILSVQESKIKRKLHPKLIQLMALNYTNSTKIHKDFYFNTKINTYYK